MKLCGEKLAVTMSFSEPDVIVGVDEDGKPVTVPGRGYDLWRVCSKRAGHRGEHGKGRRLRLRLWHARMRLRYWRYR